VTAPIRRGKSELPFLIKGLKSSG